MKKDYEEYILYGLVIIVIATLIINIGSFFGFNVVTMSATSAEIKSIEKPLPSFSKPRMTSFDLSLAKKNMDNDGDGKCDFCGMPVEMCIDSGQLQCNMDPKATIGDLGSAHIHADFKVFKNNQVINFADPKYYMKSSFVHVDDNQNKEDASSVLHMHATGVPLWLFFESIGMKFGTDCFTVDSGTRYCNNAEKSLKFYVNGKVNNEFGDYIFNDLDKILISYGDKDEGVSNQLDSVSNNAKNH